MKITVLRRMSNPDIIKEYATGVEPLCERFKEGQEFISEGLGMPEGFCSWAWADIQKDVAILALGGNAPWLKKEGVLFTCCTDGMRPVVFKVERV